MSPMTDTISASELKQTLDQFVVIDVREQDEFANSTKADSWPGKMCE